MRAVRSRPAAGLFIAASLDDTFRVRHRYREVVWEHEPRAGSDPDDLRRERSPVRRAAGGHVLYQNTPGDYVIAFALP
jgi:glucose dehydrogenase